MPGFRACILAGVAAMVFASAAAWASEAAPAPHRVPPERVQCSSAQPPYPDDPSGAVLAGIVRVKYLVDETGNVLDVQLQKTSGNEQLDASALGWARTCHFKPATRDGTPEKVWATQEVAFNRTRVCAQPYPTYPLSSRRAGESGEVAIKYQLDGSGLPVHVAVAKSSGYTALDDAAVEWFSQCRYGQSDARNGSPEAWFTQRYKFTLRD